MTAALDQALPLNNKQRVENDAKHVQVNLFANQSAMDIGRNLDTLHQQTAEAVESIKKEAVSAGSSVMETVRSYFTSEKKAEAVSFREFNEEDLQPAIQQKPTLARPSYHEQSSTDKLIKAAKEGGPSKLSLHFGSSSGALLARSLKISGRQADLRSKNTEVNEFLIEQNSQAHERLVDAYIKFDERAANRQEAADIFSWTSFGLGLLGGVLAIGGIIATVATAGSALPFVIGAAAVGVAVIGGGATIGGGVMKYLSDLDRGEAFKTKQEMGLIANGTEVVLQDIAANDRSEAAVQSSMGQLLSYLPSAFKNN